MNNRGFKEIQHTADWALHVWADDLPSLFAEAARGMNTLAGMKLTDGPRTSRNFEVAGADAESLLVAFLSELIYTQEQEHLGFDRFDIRMRGEKAIVNVRGAPLESVTKAIKAATYHNLKIEKTDRGYEVVIVFDV
jgi:SHS2 domain-containing protein